MDEFTKKRMMKAKDNRLWKLVDVLNVNLSYTIDCWKNEGEELFNG